MGVLYYLDPKYVLGIKCDKAVPGVDASNISDHLKFDLHQQPDKNVRQTCISFDLPWIGVVTMSRCSDEVVLYIHLFGTSYAVWGLKQIPEDNTVI